MRRASECKCSPRRHDLLSSQVRAAHKADRAAGLKPRSVADALSVLERPNLGSRTSSPNLGSRTSSPNLGSRTSSLRRSLNTALGAAGDAGTNGSPTRRSSSASSHRSSLSVLMDQFVSPTKAPGTTLRDSSPGSSVADLPRSPARLSISLPSAAVESYHNAIAASVNVNVEPYHHAIAARALGTGYAAVGAQDGADRRSGRRSVSAGIRRPSREGAEMGAGGAEVGVADPASLASRLMARVHAMGGYAVARVQAGAASVEGAEMGAEGAEMGVERLPPKTPHYSPRTSEHSLSPREETGRDGRHGAAMAEGGASEVDWAAIEVTSPPHGTGCPRRRSNATCSSSAAPPAPHAQHGAHAHHGVRDHHGAPAPIATAAPTAITAAQAAAAAAAYDAAAAAAAATAAAAEAAEAAAAAAAVAAAVAANPVAAAAAAAAALTHSFGSTFPQVQIAPEIAPDDRTRDCSRDCSRDRTR